MLVYLVAALEALGYLSAVPLWAAFWLSLGGGWRFGVGVGAFDGRAALRRARANGLAKPERKKHRPGPDARRVLRLLGRLRGAQVCLRGELALGDAAATALACGALGALGAALGARLGRVEIDVRPRFDGDGPRAELRGMIRARSGQIILAAARSGIHSKLNGRIAQWTDILSKAS